MSFEWIIHGRAFGFWSIDFENHNIFVLFRSLPVPRKYRFNDKERVVFSNCWCKWRHLRIIEVQICILKKCKDEQIFCYFNYFRLHVIRSSKNVDPLSFEQTRKATSTSHYHILEALKWGMGSDGMFINKELQYFGNFIFVNLLNPT